MQRDKAASQTQDSWVPKELVITQAEGAARRVPLLSDRLTLGRAHANDLAYPEDAALSRSHLAFEIRDGSWNVTDMGSKNGTFVNEKRISAPHRLGRKDCIVAGGLTIQLSDPAPATGGHSVKFVDEPPSAGATIVANLAGLLQDASAITHAKHVNALIRAGRELASDRPLAELFALIVDLCATAVGGTRAVLLTLEGGELVPQSAKGQDFRISSAVRKRVIEERTSVLVHDIRSDASLRDRESIVAAEVRSILAVPLQTDTGVLGLLYLDSSKQAWGFTQDDLNVLTVMANIAAIRIEHVRLMAVAQAELVMARDLEQAGEIQRGLLPTSAPSIPGIDLAGYNLPSRMVGGDYFDFFPYPDGRIGLLVADAAGKGMPAALLSAALQARAQIIFESPDGLAANVARLNRFMAATPTPGRYITFFIGVLDLTSGVLTYVNAGHNPPILLRQNGSIEWLSATGMVLGLFGFAPFQEQTTTLAPGDLLALYSDGVTESSAAEGSEEYGPKRLGEALRGCGTASAAAIIDAVNQSVAQFTQDAPPNDDITLVIARRPLV